MSSSYRRAHAPSLPFHPRLSSARITTHPHALLLGLQHERVPAPTVIDTGYRANVEHFAAQREIFDRMRETEREFREAVSRE